MPIYAYRCASCGHAQDVLQRISDDVLTVCPACGAASYVKQVTAAGFQLKGSGWYVTDFRGGKDAAKDGAADAAKEGTKPGATDTAKDATPAAADKAPAAAPAKTGDAAKPAAAPAVSAPAAAAPKAGA
jgi:putative FmdB family regulatory protein